MAALAGEPWRGAAASEVAITAAPANNDRAWVSFDVNAAMPSGDQATWESTAGASLTLRFRWQSNGTGSGQQAPTFATVRAMLPGGAQIGTDWVVAFPAAGTEVTRTFHFDDDPMNAALGAIRSGTVELYLVWGSTGGVAPWTADSRGVTTGTILPTNTVNHARGYARASVRFTTHSISNVAIGGAEPASFAAADPIHISVAGPAALYRAIATTASLRRPGNGVAERSGSSASTTSSQKDTSWTSTAAGLAAVIGVGMEPSTSGARTTEAKDLRIDLPATDFGGDNEYVLAATGHQAGWTRDSDLSLRYPARILVDPRVYPTSGDLTDWDADRGALFHTQAAGVEFFDPPSAGDIQTGQRVFPDLAFIGVRLINARGEGLNGLTTTLKMWDSAGVANTESTPAETISRVTETRRSGAPNTTPEAGWLPQEQTGVNRDKLPLTFDLVLGGTHRVKSVVTAPSALVGIENYPLVSGGSSWNRNVFLVVTNPNYVAVISIHPDNIQHHGSHLTPEDELIPVCYLLDQGNDKLVDLIEANGDSVTIKIVREHHPTMRMDYFDFTTEEWVGKANDGAFPPEAKLALIRGDAHGSSLGTGDPDVWTTASHLGGEIFSPDGAAGELDCMIVVDIVKDGVHYSAFAPVILVGTQNKHNSPPTGMKIGPFFDRK